MSQTGVQITGVLEPPLSFPVSSMHRRQPIVATTPTRLNKLVKMLRSHGLSKDVVGIQVSPVGMSFLGKDNGDSDKDKE